MDHLKETVIKYAIPDQLWILNISRERPGRGDDTHYYSSWNILIQFLIKKIQKNLDDLVGASSNRKITLIYADQTEYIIDSGSFVNNQDHHWSKNQVFMRYLTQHLTPNVQIGHLLEGFSFAITSVPLNQQQI